MADVFISYKREDRTWAERVDEALRAQGWSTWWDTSLVAGEHFNEAIDRELSAARCVVVIWSERARQSRWVNAEAVSGFDRDILVACRIDDVALSYPFSVVQTADLRRAPLKAVCAGVAATLNPGAAEIVKKERPPASHAINFIRRGKIGWTLLMIAAVDSAIAWVAMLSNPTFTYSAAGELWAGFIYSDWPAGSVLLGYPVLGGAGSFLVSSSAAGRPIRALWWQTALASAFAGAILGVLAFGIAMEANSTRTDPSDAWYGLALLAPPLAAGFAARVIGKLLKAKR